MSAKGHGCRSRWAATARLNKHFSRSGAWVEITPGSRSQAPCTGRDRDRGSHSLEPVNCLSDVCAGTVRL